MLLGRLQTTCVDVTTPRIPLPVVATGMHTLPVMGSRKLSNLTAGVSTHLHDSEHWVGNVMLVDGRHVGV